MIWYQDALDTLRSLIGRSITDVTIVGEHVVLTLDDGSHVGIAECEAINLGPDWPVATS